MEIKRGQRVRLLVPENNKRKYGYPKYMFGTVLNVNGLYVDFDFDLPCTLRSFTKQIRYQKHHHTMTVYLDAEKEHRFKVLTPLDDGYYPMTEKEAREYRDPRNYQ